MGRRREEERVRRDKGDTQTKTDRQTGGDRDIHLVNCLRDAERTQGASSWRKEADLVKGLHAGGWHRGDPHFA